MIYPIKHIINFLLNIELFWGVFGFTLLFLILILILIIIDKISNSVWFCNNLRWHRKPEKIERGIINRGICPRCNRKISKIFGGWF